jgi:hypothetical protein
VDDRWFKSRQVLGIFLFTTVSRPALGPIQPPIQEVPRALSLRVKRPGREADHSSPYTSAEVKNAWSYTFAPPVCLHGVVSSWKRQGKLYLFTFLPLIKGRQTVLGDVFILRKGNSKRYQKQGITVLRNVLSRSADRSQTLDEYDFQSGGPKHLWGGRGRISPDIGNHFWISRKGMFKETQKRKFWTKWTRWKFMVGSDVAIHVCRWGKVKVNVKLSLCLTKHHAMKTYWGGEV